MAAGKGTGGGVSNTETENGLVGIGSEEEVRRKSRFIKEGPGEEISKEKKE